MLLSLQQMAAVGMALRRKLTAMVLRSVMRRARMLVKYILVVIGLVVVVVEKQKEQLRGSLATWRSLGARSFARYDRGRRMISRSQWQGHNVVDWFDWRLGLEGVVIRSSDLHCIASGVSPCSFREPAAADDRLPIPLPQVAP